jgi:hypothetical protein
VTVGGDPENSYKKTLSFNRMNYNLAERVVRTFAQTSHLEKAEGPT